MSRYPRGPGDPRAFDESPLSTQSHLEFPSLHPDAPTLLREHTIYVRDPDRILAVHASSRQRDLQNLIRRYISQLQYGCLNPSCSTPTCWSCIERRLDPPPRKFTVLSARALALTLVSQDEPEKNLCPNKQPVTLELEDEAILQSKQSQSRQHRNLPTKRRGSTKKAREEDNGPQVIESGANGESMPLVVKPLRSKTKSETPGENAKEQKRSSKREKGLKSESQSRMDPKSITQNWCDTHAVQSLDKLYLPNDKRLLCNRFAPVGHELHYPCISTAYESEFRKQPQPERSTKRVRNNHPSKQSSKGGLNPDKFPNTVGESYSILFSKLSPSTYPRQSSSRERLNKSLEDHTCRKSRLRSGTGSSSIPPSPGMGQANCTAARQVSWDSTFLDKPTAPPIGESFNKPDASQQLSSKLLFRPPETLSILNCPILSAISAELKRLDHVTVEERELMGRGHLYLPMRSNGSEPTQYSVFSAFVDQSIHYSLANFNSVLQSFRTPCQCESRSGSKDALLYCCQETDDALRPLMSLKKDIVLKSMWISLRALFDPPSELVPPRSPRLRNGSVSKSESQAPKVSAFCDLNSPTKGKFDTDWNIFHATILAFQILAALVPITDRSTWIRYVMARSAGYMDFVGNGNASHVQAEAGPLLGKSSGEIDMGDSFDSDIALRLAARLVRGLAAQIHYVDLLRSRAHTSKFQSHEMRSEQLTDSIVNWLAGTLSQRGTQKSATINHGWSMPEVILQWVQNLFLKNWDGKEEVQRFGVAGSCLSVMSIFYEHRERLCLGGRTFWISAIPQRLEFLETPSEWYESKPNPTTIHVLSHCFLFESQYLVTYFRCLNYASMSASSEGAISLSKLVGGLSILDPTRNRTEGSVSRRLTKSLAKHFVLRIRRDNILTDALDQLWKREKSELMRPLKVKMGSEEGEEGLDMGGVQQEFFRLALNDALDPDRGLFTIDQETKMVWFQPYSFESLYKFELVGLLVGLAVYNGVTLPVTFPLAMYRMLLGQRIDSIAHIRDGWPALAKSFIELLDWSEGDVQDVFCCSFTFNFSLGGKLFEVDMSHFQESLEWPYHGGCAYFESIPQSPCHDDTATLETLIKRHSDSLHEKVSVPAPFIRYSDLIRRFQPSTTPRPLVDDTSSVSEPEDNRRRLLNSRRPSTLTPWKQDPHPRFLSELDTDDEISESPGLPDGGPRFEAPMVTNANRRPFVRNYIKWLTCRSIGAQAEAFTRGFFSIVDIKAISLFSPEALRDTVEGGRDITFQALKNTATYEGDLTPEHGICKTFWAVVEKFSPEDLKRLLIFVTASDRVPVGGLHNIEFVIQLNGGDSERLPTSFTCFGRLLLPNYSTEEKMEKKLRAAMSNSEGFGIT